jgi:prepilin-type N-terminal cleavage/methylation domain-containing protein
MNIKQKRGFTLIELLITIGIVSVMSTVTVLTVNPAEMFKQARDAQRLNDIAILQRIISYLQLGGKSIGTANTVYVSVQDVNNQDCSAVGMPESLQGGWVYYCAYGTPDLINGQGWLPVDLGAPLSSNENEIYTASLGRSPPTIYSTGGAAVSKLPVDPSASVANGLYYRYLTDGSSYEFVVKFESAKYLAKAQNDDGSDSARYETGNLALWTAAKL